ncbi:MAG: 2-oxoacid:acceptor oxidoreductase family protein [Lachnospiraceae bacterium]|nr:2-oxoacid:acceptor oxidoreductase family protein [Lachnospiraceae bacterium]
MSKTLEIRWHGRGGQGAKTAALLLADVAFSTGAYVQGFPEYGPERMGAPITAYNRISDEDIRVHSNIYTPDLVVVVDETLLHSVDVTAGLKEDGAILINTPSSVEEITPMLKGYKGKVYTIDACKISIETLGKNFPNTPMLAAVVAITKVMDREPFIANMQESYEHKFAKKPEVIEGNMKALTTAYDAAAAMM